MPTNFEPKRLKPKLDIVEKPENRVHKLTDSNVWGVVKGTFGTFCLSSQIFGKCQTFCGAKSAESAKL